MNGRVSLKCMNSNVEMVSVKYLTPAIRVLSDATNILKYNTICSNGTPK